MALNAVRFRVSVELSELLQRYSGQVRQTVNPERTICEVLREIWDISEALREEDLRTEIQARIVRAYDMAKRMNAKLREYKHDWDQGFWERNADYESDLKRRSKRK